MNVYSTLKNRRGEALVEAAIVWPFVVALLIFTCVTVVYFAHCTILQSDMHIALLVEEGKESGTRTFNIKEKDFDFSRSVCHGRGSINCKRYVEVKGFPKMSRKIEDTVHILNEKRTIRYKDLFDEIV